MVPIRENERARDFLSLFVLSEQADSGHILIQQEKDGGDFGTVTLSLKDGPDATLRSGDVITVPSRKNTAEILVVVVTGDVAHPGVFPIAPGSTAARSVIDLAGGYLPSANTDKAVIIRRNKLPTNHSSEKPVQTEIGRPISPVRPELASALSMMSSTEDFSVIRIKEYPATSLQPWDQILVPRAEKVVYVSGNVNRPGGYPYKEGMNKAHYLRLAGGLTKKANSSNVYIVALFGDIMQTCDHKIVEDGDIIVVPASQEYKRLSTLVLPILNAAIGTLALIVAVMSQR
jgi:polysaccharide export outer membrane protein